MVVGEEGTRPGLGLGKGLGVGIRQYQSFPIHDVSGEVTLQAPHRACSLQAQWGVMHPQRALRVLPWNPCNATLPQPRTSLKCALQPKATLCAQAEAGVPDTLSTGTRMRLSEGQILTLTLALCLV